MSDYTPTTEEVSGIYWWRKLTDRYGVNAVYRNHTEEEAQFDRWLAGIKAQAWADGYTAGTHDWRTESLTTPNPYRQGEKE